MPAFQGGVTGQTSTEAAFRLGAHQLSAQIAGGSIPASGAVTVQILSPAGFWAPGQAWTFDVTARVRGLASAAATMVAGTLRKLADESWTFTASGLTAAVSAPLEVLFVSTQAIYSSRGIIYRAGRNNIGFNDPNFVDTVARDYRAARAFVYATQARPRFLALPIYNPRNAPAGIATYDQYMAANAAIAKETGADYYNLRRWMITNGLAAVGIAPTAQDTTDIGNDVLPTSLSLSSGDVTHLSVAGRIAEARQLAFVLTARDWFTS